MKPETTPPRTSINPTVKEMIEWLDWYQSNIIKPSPDNHWLGNIRSFLAEVQDVYER